MIHADFVTVINFKLRQITVTWWCLYYPHLSSVLLVKMLSYIVLSLANDH